ncbi:MAG: Plasmid pRiA4b ORF-3-like protein [Pelotomaculum sp. PtaB.Bin104]|nr:MAG: Plasmid pRiA4b ORF-3-like protein [Pelotomaculum sp. PtaB.Bin104]
MENIIASLNDLSPTTDDFGIFCSYLQEKMPRLTKVREELGKKDCFAINELLAKPMELDAPKYLQYAYPTINLFFQIVMETGLFVPEAGRNGDLFIVPSPRLKQYKELNQFSQYMFLFRTYWTKLDYDLLYWDTGAFFDHFMDTKLAFAALKNAVPGKRIFAAVEDFRNGYDNQDPVHRFFVSTGMVIHHLRDFGFWDYERAHIAEFGRETKKDLRVKAITPTKLGIAMINACLKRPYELYNEKINPAKIDELWHDEHYRPLADKLGVARPAKKTKLEPFEKAFLPIFPVGSIALAAIDDLFSYGDVPVDIGGNVYIFKVTYKRGVWRRIRLSALNTLDHLHEAIQEAFGFADDHLYAFFMDGRPWSSDVFWCRGGDEPPPYADKAMISALGLKRGQRFLYLFDFGDEWKFEVKVEEIMQSDIPPAKPKIIESKGAAPEQYPEPDWEE